MDANKGKKKKQVQRRLPGNKTVTHYERKMTGKQVCAKCGAELHGLPRNTRWLSKTEKSVNRPYGGHYCSKCSREKIIEISVDE